ncbi:MAG: general secretion pathway protein GspB [Woeseia sp.]
MSFILDALKKSETERQRKNAPGFADVREGSDPPRAPRWLWVLGILLAINLVVLLGVMLRPDFRAIVEMPAADEIPAADEQAVRQPSFSEMVEEARQKQSQQVLDAQVGKSDVSALEPAPKIVSNVYATFNELRANGTLVLPDLHLDIHVYSEKPGERFVFINMNKYREQARLAEGPLVKEITPEGVILEHLGSGFLLPRE